MQFDDDDDIFDDADDTNTMASNFASHMNKSAMMLDVDPAFGAADLQDDLDQEDVWTIISAHFDEKGLVRQQLDSFDEFIQNTIQAIVEEDKMLILEQHPQHTGSDDDVAKQYSIEFGQTYVGRPFHQEGDGERTWLFPQLARLRNLTYDAVLQLEMKMSLKKESTNAHGDRVWVEDLSWTRDRPEEANFSKINVGTVPLMVRSKYCPLSNMSDEDAEAQGECPYDMGGYFIIRGSEKVLIAQERMATNQVYVFQKTAGTYSYSAEVRSQPEKGNKIARQVFIKVLNKGAQGDGQLIHTTLPNIKVDIPIIAVFRALGFISDQDVLKFICYDFNDTQMLEMLKPCIEEAFIFQDQHVALEYIGGRGAVVGANEHDRVRYCQDILDKEFLPHIATEAHRESEKAYFFGYMIHRLCLAALERRETDDRDHFGKKRLDMAGSLMGNLFRMLFIKLKKDIGAHMRK
ncbi:DNA-dependent RNA polymerase II, partial [Nowakowskiella sp. JEL0078]